MHIFSLKIILWNKDGSTFHFLDNILDSYRPNSVCYFFFNSAPYKIIYVYKFIAFNR